MSKPADVAGVCKQWAQENERARRRDATRATRRRPLLPSACYASYVQPYHLLQQTRGSSFDAKYSFK